ncbi:Arm DNA-binding domain-containing protein [Candidatus Electronema sp. JM]|uniref:Arm DNA-binding domain-containing protein n=1 Tax=Candidatus Electronema sp. JM TaxID=3401571 RepID=UPI003AA7D7A2
MSKLTAVQIRQAKPKDKPYKLPDGQGLYFHVAESGKSTWCCRFRVDGKESICVLGEQPITRLPTCREP